MLLRRSGKVRVMKTSRSKPVSTDKLAHVWDVIHFIRMGEIRYVTFGWYRMKFKSDTTEATANRAWERFKSFVREIKVPHERVLLEDEDDGALKMVVRFMLPEALLFVEKMLEARQGPDEDESRWVTREEGQHPESRGSHRGDHPLQGYGQQRDGHLSVRAVDARKRTG